MQTEAEFSVGDRTALSPPLYSSRTYTRIGNLCSRRERKRASQSEGQWVR
jgi:hypothetical protein